MSPIVYGGARDQHERHRIANKKYGLKPRSKFLRQKNSAKWRGIEWLLTFDEWMSIWLESGHFADRGIGVGKYVMARRGDVGPYSVGNVEIIPFEANCADSRTNNPREARDLVLAKLGTGRGWAFCRNGYQVTLCGLYVGRFKTQAEAEAAYKVAVDTHIHSIGEGEYTSPRVARERSAKAAP